MSERLGIVFMHHRTDAVTENNLRSIRRSNPDAVVATITSGTPFPGGYTLDATPELKRLHESLPKRSGDRLICSWFQQRREECERWWLVEWDTYCAMSVRDYYRPVWEYPFVACNVRLRNREPEWHWFPRLRKRRFRKPKGWELPEEYAPFAMGTVPFLYLMSEAVLKATCTMLIENPILVGNSELRFTTAANRCGHRPCAFSPPDDQITWVEWEKAPEKITIAHPVKFLLG